ncbi:hypothetical protein TrST_g2484 [Triparma strigata]|uniref:Conserved oligomeric Golgi complex subunit 4 C-terminal domain-containing protein n=1 Tax=Triparma strigata TaxID=1606541 RepID=A0A9W7A6M5_9STRA|nr:hypothetical protein TrST_g2484 [Triparma strigata]
MPPLNDFYVALSTHLSNPSPSTPTLLPCIQSLLLITSLPPPSDSTCLELIADAKKKCDAAITQLAETSHSSSDDSTAASCVEFWCAFDLPSSTLHDTYVLNKFRETCKVPLKNLSETREDHVQILAEILASGSIIIQGLYQWQDAVASGGGGGDVPNNILKVIDRVETKMVDEIGKVVKAIISWFYKDAVESVDSANLASLDKILDDVSYASNLLLRYNLFLRPSTPSTTTSQTHATLKATYLSLETSLLTSAINKSIKTSTVIEVQDNVQGPSYCDDVYAVCLKALQRSDDAGVEEEMKTTVKKMYEEGGVVWKAVERNVACFVEEGRQEIKDADEKAKKSTLDMFASALLDAVDDDIGGAGDVWRYSEEERLTGVLRRVVGVWMCWRGCGGLDLEEEGLAWKKRLEKEIETLVESNVGGEGVDEFESIEKSLPWRILSLTFDRIDFCVKDPETFQKLDSDEIVEKFVVRPVDECRLVQFLTKGHKLGEDEIALMVYRVIARQFAKLFYKSILTTKKVGPWGAMLAQKYLRSVMKALLNDWDCGEMALREEFEKCSEAVFLLGLEKVKDYAMFYKAQGRSAAVLGEDEVRRVLGQREDFDERDL